MSEMQSEECRQWDRWKGEGDPEARGWLIEHFAFLVRVTRQRHFRELPPAIEADDLESVGHIRLIGAVDGFEPAPERRFPPYACRAIRWGMNSAIRRANWVPDATETGRSTQFLSLDEPVEAQNGTATLAELLEDREMDVSALVFAAQASERLRDQVERLPPRERELVRRYYEEEAESLRAAAEQSLARRVSPSAYCRIHRRALNQLRSVFGEDELLKSLIP